MSDPLLSVVRSPRDPSTHGRSWHPRQRLAVAVAALVALATPTAMPVAAHAEPGDAARDATVATGEVSTPDTATDGVAAAAESGPVMYPSGVGADLGATPTTLGIRPRAGDNPDGVVTGELDGRGYWKTDRAAGTSYVVFDLDADYLRTLDAATDVTVTVTYHDTGTGALALYADPDGTDPLAELPLGDSGTWRSHTAVFPGDALAGHGGLRLGLAPDGPEQDFLVASVRVGAVGARVDLGPTPNQAGITPRAGDNGAGLVTGVHDGRGYWQTNASAPPPATTYLYMNVADTYVYDTRNPVVVIVDYVADGNGRFRLQYDSPGDTIPDMFKNSEVVSYGDTQTWETHTFTLPDAIMTNRSNGSDFRLSTDGERDLKVGSVRVAVVAGELDGTEGLRDLIAEAERVHRVAREGDRDGQYPEGSKATLAAAIADARAVVEQPDATEATVKEALHALFDALRTFEESVIDTNLAKGATATASSSAPDSTPARAVDGDDDSAWTSGAGGDGAWLQVDLGRVQPVNEVRAIWGGAYAADYTVAVSADGTDWTTVGRQGAASNRAVPTAFETVDARYVRLSVTAYAPASNRVEVRELEVRRQRVVRPDARLVTTRHPTEDYVVADVDVTSYGADPTGRKDSTKAIQQAVYDCYDAGGGTVWMPAGTYRVTDTIEVYAFCTVRGDRRDPDRGAGSYGTVVVADLPSGDDGPTLFRLGGSAGVMGVTTYYPRQDAADPVPYNYTFEIPGGAWVGPQNYMMATISDVTMLNSYRGIGISTMPSDAGTAPSSGQVHESSTIRNVKGTALYEGVRAYNGADVGTWENVTFSNAYWAQAGPAYNAPDRATLDAWTRAHGTGFTLGDLEWDHFYRVAASDYAVGIRIVPGQRASFTGSFVDARIERTDIALAAESFDSRWGLVLAGGVLEGSEYAIHNESEAFVKLTDVEVSGPTTGIVHRMAGEVPSYAQAPLPRPMRPRLYDVSKAPYEAPRGVGYLPAADATPAIQRALDAAGADGGGIVYLPAGWYRLESRLRVPANVELRGASPVPNRDQLMASRGTVLFAYDGRATSQPDTAPALVTLDGSRAGVRGLRVFYPGNNPNAPEGLVPYPYAIRADGPGTYVVNVGMPNAWNGVDVSSPRSDRFTVRKLTGAFFRHAVTVGQNTGGRIEGVLTNGNAVARIGYAPPSWLAESDLFAKVIDRYMREQTVLVSVDGATKLTLLNVFGYGVHDGLVVDAGEVTAWNLGTDNLGADGYTVKVADGVDQPVVVTNLARYNGATSTGPVTLYNIMAINMVQQSVRVVASPAEGGTVRLVGHETEPGRYERGSEVTATATAAAGYRFQHWTVDGEVVSDQPAYTFTVTADAVLTATFTPTGTAAGQARDPKP